MARFFGNDLLDELPVDTLRVIQPHLQREYLQRGAQLSRPDRPRDGLVFPVDALIWEWCTAEGNRVVSLYESGRRGASGGGAWLGPMRPGYTTVLLSGSAWMLSGEAAIPMLGDLAFARLVRRWLHDRFWNCAHRLACAAEHNLDRRLARALLSLMDETGRPEIALTHREISTLTGIRRPSVSLALADFQQHGIVRLRHGLVQVIDRNGLERQSCECYRSISASAGTHPDYGQDVSPEGQTIISRISQPRG